MKRLILIVLITILASASASHAEVSPEKRKEIDKMLRLTGMEKLVDQMKSQMVAGMKEQMPQIPASFWTKFQEKMDARQLLEKIVPIYDKYYTVEDLKAVNAFYESPAGQKVLSTLPQVMQESLKVGQEWGAEIGKQAADEASKEMKKN